MTATQADIIAETLDAAALHCNPAEGVPFFAVVMSDLTAEELQKAWDHFCDRLRVVRALDMNLRHWSLEFGDEALRPFCDEERPTDAALQEAAVQLACEEADLARRALLDGSGI